MRQIEYPEFNAFPAEIVLLDEDFDAEMILPEYNDYVETGSNNGNYYE